MGTQPANACDWIKDERHVAAGAVGGSAALSAEWACAFVTDGDVGASFDIFEVATWAFRETFVMEGLPVKYKALFTLTAPNMEGVDTGVYARQTARNRAHCCSNFCGFCLGSGKLSGWRLS